MALSCLPRQKTVDPDFLTFASVCQKPNIGFHTLITSFSCKNDREVAGVRALTGYFLYFRPNAKKLWLWTPISSKKVKKPEHKGIPPCLGPHGHTSTSYYNVTASAKVAVQNQPAEADLQLSPCYPERPKVKHPSDAPAAIRRNVLMTAKREREDGTSFVKLRRRSARVFAQYLLKSCANINMIKYASRFQWKGYMKNSQIPYLLLM